MYAFCAPHSLAGWRGSADAACALPVRAASRYHPHPQVTLAKDQENTPQKYRIRNAEKQVEAKEKKLRIFKELISANLVDLTAVLDRSDQQVNGAPAPAHAPIPAR